MAVEQRLAALEAAEASRGAVSAGDNAWLLVSSALVLMMTVPGLALFYGGMVRRKNVLNTIALPFVALALVSVDRRFNLELVPFDADGSGVTGAPVIIETNPTYYNLFGRIEKNIEHFYVFEIDENIIACVTLYFYPDMPELAEIGSLYVLPFYHHRGIGKKMVEYAWAYSLTMSSLTSDQ